MRPYFDALVIVSNRAIPGRTWNHAKVMESVRKTKEFYAPVLDMNITVIYRDFGVPEWGPLESIIRNDKTPGVTRRLVEAWQDKTITRTALFLGKQRMRPYHAVALALDDTDWKGEDAQGMFGDCSQGVGQIYFNGNRYRSTNGVEIDTFHAHLTHELFHFACKFLGVPDITHDNLIGNTGMIRAEALKHLKVTTFYAIYRASMEWLRNKTRADWGII